MDRSLAIGITGSLGSGASTLAEALRTHLPFATFSLSDEIKTVMRKWPREEHPRRIQLQDMGNALRRSLGTHYLASVALERANALEQRTDRYAFDGIRHRAEVEHLRSYFRHFFLIAVQAPYKVRWERLKPAYETRGLSEKDFQEEDLRDQIEESPYGQQVQLCVDDADIVINNTDTRQSHAGAVRGLRDKIEPYIDLMTGEHPRLPGRDEILITIAYAQAASSACLKRHVGAVAATQSGQIISTGFNENAEPMKACYQQFGYCHKDSTMAGFLERLPEKYCPACASEIDIFAPPWRCARCGASLKEVYFRDRGMRWCTAMHAEVRALRNACLASLQDAVLYTTTFPCYNCAKEVVHAGIKEVVYVEPYPDQDSVWYLEECGIKIRPFEGVKLRSFHRLFSPIRERMEQEYDIERAP